MDIKIISKSAIGINKLSRSKVVVYESLVSPREVETFFMRKKHYPQFKNKYNK